MVKKYQLWYFQLGFSLSFYLVFLLEVYVLYIGFFLTNTEELLNQTCHGKKEKR